MILWLLLMWPASMQDPAAPVTYVDVFETRAECEAGYEALQSRLASQVNHRCLLVDPGKES